MKHSVSAILLIDQTGCVVVHARNEVPDPDSDLEECRFVVSSLQRPDLSQVWRDESPCPPSPPPQSAISNEQNGSSPVLQLVVQWGTILQRHCRPLFLPSLQLVQKQSWILIVFVFSVSRESKVM
jgi:hypothetical protein